MLLQSNFDPVEPQTNIENYVNELRAVNRDVSTSFDDDGDYFDRLVMKAMREEELKRRTP